MTKIDIAERIHIKLDVSKKDAAELLEYLLTTMKHTLEDGEKIKISGFGVFEIKQKKNRTGRNPQTGEAMTIVARKILSFKPSAVLKSAVNQK